jgi:hypothetical protein
MNIKQSNLILAVTAGLILVIILAFWNYKVNENVLMSKNIQDAMSKGIDPLSVRCTYAADTDNICLAYALRSREHNTDIPAPPRK